MTDIFDYITRFVVICLGYCGAVLAAGFFLAAMLYSQIDILNHAQSDPFFQDMFAEFQYGWGMSGFYVAVLVGGPIIAFMVGNFSFLPALIIIVMSEVRGWKSSLPYCIGGLAIGLFASGTGSFFVNTEYPLSGKTALLLASLSCAGIIGGFVYWLIAGRNAGKFLEKPANFN